MQDFLGHFKETNIYPYKNRNYSGWAYLKKAMLAAFVLLAGLVFYFLFSAYFNAVAAKNNLAKASQEFRTAKLENGGKFLAKSQANFEKAKSSLEKLKIFSYLPPFKKDFLAAESILTIGGEATAAVNKLFIIVGAALPKDQSAEVSFSALSADERKKIFESIIENKSGLGEVKGNIDRAFLAYGAMPGGGFFNLEKKFGSELDKFLTIGREAQTLLSIIEIMPELAGYTEDKTYLFLLQNNTELRPGGGFIGTYGTVKVGGGEIKSFFTSDVYALDRLAIGTVKIEPPAPLKRYLGVNYWYMRDANWSPDFSVSAAKVEDFYHQEGGLEKIDGVIAITPDVVADVLRILGPIKIEDQEFTADNLTDALEYRVEVGFAEKGIPRAQRKEIIGVLAKIILERIYALPLSDWPAVISALGTGLLEKHIMLTAKDAAAQAILDREDWSGKVKETASDYLMTVDANLNALKSDPEVARGVYYRITRDSERYLAAAALSYKHSGKRDWKTGRYRSYTRLFAPLGSKLISVTQDGGKDERTKDAEVGEDLGKTYFGIFLTVEIGGAREVTFRYELPERIKYQIEQNLYSLLVEKQPGTIANRLTLELDFGKRIREARPEKITAGNPNIYNYVTDLRVDRMFTVGF
ncbi:MAG: DUF4012 domain-containing protein [Patescibacteria group bacterium]